VIEGHSFHFDSQVRPDTSRTRAFTESPATRGSAQVSDLLFPIGQQARDHCPACYFTSPLQPHQRLQKHVGTIRQINRVERSSNLSVLVILPSILTAREIYKSENLDLFSSITTYHTPSAVTASTVSLRRLSEFNHERHMRITIKGHRHSSACVLIQQNRVHRCEAYDTHSKQTSPATQPINLRPHISTAYRSHYQTEFSRSFPPFS
jgi:hypothetical protein